MLGSGAFPATMTSNDSAAQTADSRVGTLTAVDSRTGRSYEFPISEDTIPAIKLRGIKVHEEDFGMLSFDPALLNTAVCHSAITFIDGDKGILDYRGYSIEEMSSLSSFVRTMRSGSSPTRWASLMGSPMWPTAHPTTRRTLISTSHAQAVT